MLYSVYCQDNANTAEARAKDLVIHRAYLDVWMDKIFFSGPLQSDDAQIALGSLFILNVENRDEAAKFIDNEPFNKAGIFGSITIRRMRKGRYNPTLIEGL